MRKLVFALVACLSATAFGQMKAGFVDSDKLFDTLPSRKAAETKYMEFEKGLYEELQGMQIELEKSARDLEMKAADLSPVLLEAEQRKIMRKQEAFQIRQQEAQQELQAYSQELNGPLLERIQSSVKIVAERKKLTYVVDQNTTLYFDPTLDITNEVIVELLKLDAAASSK